MCGRCVAGGLQCARSSGSASPPFPGPLRGAGLGAVGTPRPWFLHLPGCCSTAVSHVPALPAECVPRAAGGHPVRTAGWALVHVLPTLPAHVLGPALPVSCRAHTRPWQLRWERLRAQLAGDVTRGSGTLTRTWVQSHPQAPTSGVLCCPHSTALPRPPSPRQHHHLPLFFLKE